ncbi:MAG: FkbM family methyltransferase, partial [Alphaproteobacteria bacterium]|nr:FkbM family methyltransferase [Alphaproteobacteria bacterium]
MIKTIELDWRFGRIELPAQDRYIRPAIKITGEYSGGEIDLYQALLNPGDTALDVGANISVFTIAMGLAVGGFGKVIAFEPQPPIFDILRRNIDRCGL